MATAAFAALLTEFLILGWLAGELRFLAPHRRLLFSLHGELIVSVAAVLFLNLCAAYYGLARWFLLRDTGRKLRHLDHQLATRDAALDELGDELSA